MAVVLPDPDTEFGARVARRLREDATAWLTLADPARTPQPAPVWFLWDDDSSCVVLYSQPTAKRLARMKANPRCSLHLNDDGTGHDFVVLTGRIAEAADLAPADQNPAYAQKYRDWMVGVFGSAERFATMFSVPLRFEPASFRGD
jgi:PPOX class probable F420-dependent enzyme